MQNRESERGGHDRYEVEIKNLVMDRRRYSADRCWPVVSASNLLPPHELLPAPPDF